LLSIQPSCPNINTALTTYYSLKTNVGFAAGASSSVSAKAKGGFEPILQDAAHCTKVGFPKFSFDLGHSNAQPNRTKTMLQTTMREI